MKKGFIVTLYCLFLCVGFAQELKIKINHQYQDQGMVYESNYVSHENTVFLVERLQYYISGFVLKYNDGSIKTIEDQYILVSSNISDYEFFNADSIGNLGDIDSIGFSIGVDEDANHSDPTSYSFGHSLALTNPSMHWGWTAGYRFIAFEGLCDNDNDNEAEKMMQMHVTGDDNYYTAVPMINVEPEEIDGDFMIEFIFDLYYLLQGYKLDEVGVKHGVSEVHEQMLENIENGIVFVDEVLIDTTYVIDTTLLVDTTEGTSSIYENSLNYSITIHKGTSYAPTIFYQFKATENVNLQVLDLFGKVVYEVDNLHYEGNHFIKKELANGYYFAKFNVANKMYTERFIVQ
jgi:hypothetical protein